MKAAVSIPDDVFADLESHAEDTGESRSAVITKALRQYLGKIREEAITRQLNAVYGEDYEPAPEEMEFLRRAGGALEWRRPYGGNPSGRIVGMKVTVSLPDELFDRLEDHRERCGQTRSAMFQAALERYLLRREMEELKAEYDQSYSGEMAEEDARLAAAGAAAMAQILKSDPW